MIVNGMMITTKDNVKSQIAHSLHNAASCNLYSVVLWNFQRSFLFFYTAITHSETLF